MATRIVNNLIICRWNGNSSITLRMWHRVTGTYLDLVLRPRKPTFVDRIWLDSPDFNRFAVNDQECKEPDKIVWWEGKDLPESTVLNVEGLTPDLAETLRQIITLPEAVMRKEYMTALLTITPGPNKSMSHRFAQEKYRPFLKRVIEEEAKFQNRQWIIDTCKSTLLDLKREFE